MIHVVMFVRHVWVCFLGLLIGLFLGLFIGLFCSTGLSCPYHLMCASVIVDFVSVTVDFVIPVCETGQEGNAQVSFIGLFSHKYL